MGLIARLSLSFNTFQGRAKLGALERGLIDTIHISGIDSARAQHFIAQIVRTAWNMRIISSFFESLEFSFEDYTMMYTVAVRACPHLLIQRDHLIATHILIDHYRRLGQGLYAYSYAASGQTGHARAQGLTALIQDMVHTVVDCQGHECITIEQYLGLTQEGVPMDKSGDR